MTNALHRLGCYAARRPFVVIGTWLALAVLVIIASTTLGRELEDTFAVPGLDSQQAVDLLAAAGSEDAGLTAQVVAAPLAGGGTFDVEINRGALEDLAATLERLPKVVSVAEPMVSPTGDVALLQVQYPVFEELRPVDLAEIEHAIDDARAGSPLRIELGGDLSARFDDGDTGLAEMIGLGAAIVILLLAFGSLIAAGLPIAVAIFGLAVGTSSFALVNHLIDIPAWSPDLATMIGLGVGIDYALFLVTRYREHLRRGAAVEEAVGHAVATAGQSVIFAGGTVIIAILGVAVAGVPFLTAAGVATSVTVLLMVLASITLVPAFLGLSGHRIDRFTLGRFTLGRRRTEQPTVTHTGWERWGRHVSRHARRYAVGVTVFLLALTAPVLALRLGNPDQGTLPDSRTERRAYDLVAEGFGPGINGPLLIAVDVSAGTEPVDAIAAAIAADRGIASVAPADVDADAGVATILAIPSTAPQDQATVDTIERLRSDVLPSAIDDSPARAHVGGQTAMWADVAGRVSDRMPVFIAAVVLLSFVLLTVVFRAPVVALKAAVLNLLSIGAAYGVLVMVFQWGWGKDLIGLESTIPVIAFIPMFMFAILFGLSMDYEVFLLARVREEYQATGDNETAVIRGIAGTARVITSAALIMISVFLGFVLGDEPTMKMFGLGLATAIFVDATIVRIILVPALMKLMGDANWWLPAWLERVLPGVDLERDPVVGSVHRATVP